jgi:T5SS/PEP-CTERM-associated repeat protein
MATIVYSGLGIAGDWSDPDNWNGGEAPGTADLAQITNGTSNTFGGDISVNSIMIINGGTDTFTGSVTTAGAGSCQGLMVCVGSTMVFVPGSSLTDGGVFLVGVDAAGGFIADGTSALATTIESDTATIGAQDTGVGTVTIDDASWTTAKSLIVGKAGTGTLNVLDGGAVTVGGSFAMALENGSTGTVTLSSGGLLTVDGAASIGGGDASKPLGAGTLTVDAGSTFDVKDSMAAGYGATLDLAGGTVSAGDTSGHLSISAGGKVVGDGTLTTRAGGWISDSGIIAATGGTLTIDASVAGTGKILVGDDSTVAITGKALLTAKFDFIGADSTLSLAHGAIVKSSLTGFTFSDHIEMAGIDKAVWDGAKQTLVLSDAGKAVDALHLVGSYAADVFTVTQSGGIGVITLHAASTP